MQTPYFRSDLTHLTWFDIRNIRHYLSTSLMCIFLLLSLANNLAIAQSESESQQVEVPQALGPDAMKSLVSKLDEDQTAALVELMGLLQTPASGEATSANGESAGTLRFSFPFSV